MKRHALLFAIALATLFVNAQIPTNGLVGYWPFNGNAVDESGNGNNGTVNGATLTTDRFGNIEAAYNFSDRHFIRIPHSNIFEFGTDGDFTYSIWIKPSSSNPNNWSVYLTTACPGSTGGGFQAGISNGNFFMEQTGINQPLSTGITLNDDNWHHIILVFDRASDIISLYHNGSYVANVSTPAAQSNPGSCLYGILVGASRDQELLDTLANASYCFYGDADDLRLYNRVLNTDEITALYQEVPEGPCLVAHYPFTGSAVDISGNNNHGTVNGATLTEDRFGNPNSAYYFDGNDYIVVPHSSSIDINGDQLTISAWAKGMNQVLQKGDWSNRKYGLFVNGDYTLGFELNTSEGWSDILNGNVDTSTWSHLSLTYDGSIMKEYINGNLVGTFSKGGNIVSNTQDLVIGAFGSMVESFFIGTIDDIKIFTCALDSTEIQDLYNEGLCFETVTDTVIVNDTLTTLVYDTITTQVFDTTYTTIFDTLTTEVFDTTIVTVYDTVTATIYDTMNVTVYDTMLVSVNDTLIIPLYTSTSPLPTDVVDNNIWVYPNPASSILNIELGEADAYTYSVVIRNELGQVVFGDYTFTTSTQIDITGYNAGLYFIDVMNNDTGYTTTRKLLFE